MRPKIGAKICPGDGALSGLLNGNGKSGSSLASPSENSPEVLPGDPHSLSQIRDGIDTRREVHDSRVKKIFTESRVFTIAKGQKKYDNLHMGKAKRDWLKRPSFRVLCDLWINAHPDKTKRDLALLMGMKDERVFKQYYSGAQCPGPQLIKRMAKALGVTEEELIDDPEQPSPMPDLAEVWASTDIRVRALAETMMREAREIPPEKIPDFIAMLIQGQETAFLFAKGKVATKK